MWGYLILSVIYHLFRVVYGDGTFDNVIETGPYAVGYKEVKTPKGNFVAVYYPIDKAGGMSTSKDDKRKTWFGFISGPSMLDTIQKVFKWRRTTDPSIP